MTREPLDFEMLDSASPYYQAGLRNNYVMNLLSIITTELSICGIITKVSDATYKITDISLEYEIVTQPDLARLISGEHQHMVLPYDRVLRHRQIRVNKLDTTWNWPFNTPCRSLKGILVLFEEERSYERDTSKF